LAANFLPLTNRSSVQSGCQDILRSFQTPVRWSYLVLGLMGAIGLGWAALQLGRTLYQKFCPKLTPFKDYPQLGKEALQFAKQYKMEENGIVSKIYEKEHQPTNFEINRSVTLLWQTLYPDLIKAMQKYASTEKPWEQAEVIIAADACMKVAYSISCLTLEDLKPFTEKMAIQVNSSYYTNLTRQDSYQCRTFFTFSFIYHTIRGEYVWAKVDQNDPDDPGELVDPISLVQEGLRDQGISESHAKLFYISGQVQHKWNQLYNDYCDRVYMYVERENLYNSDSRFVKWTRKDMGTDTFVGWPTSLPN